MVESLLRRAAHLQLHHIDGIGHENDHIGTATRHFYLSVGTVVEDGEDDVCQHLVIGLVFGDVV